MSIIIANWKMNLNQVETVRAAKKLVQLCAGHEGKSTVVVCPNTLFLREISDCIFGSSLVLGAQDCFWEARGAFSGDVSPEDLYAIGCRYCILGHSEQRRYHQSTNEEIRKKVALCIQVGMNPILCVGESAEERRLGKTDVTLGAQVRESLNEVKLLTTTQLVIAYEPVWAIGVGTPASPEDFQHALLVIERELQELGIPKNHVSIIYGGSVSRAVLKGFLEKGAEGFLIGTESKDPERFFEIVKEVEANI